MKKKLNICVLFLWKLIQKNLVYFVKIGDSNAPSKRFQTIAFAQAGWKSSHLSVCSSWLYFVNASCRGEMPGVSGRVHGTLPRFWKSVNPISTRGTDYSQHITTCHIGFSDLPTALSWTEVWSILSKALEAKVCTTSVPEGQCLALGQHQGILRESIGCKCDWFRILLEILTFLVISY